MNDKDRQAEASFGSRIAAPLIFIGAVAIALPSFFTRRGFRKREFNYYIDLCGVQSVPIVLLICFLMGTGVSLQSVLQLRKFGAEVFNADLVGFAVLKEFGPLMVAIIATGRAGSAFAAEIGTMKVNEEISALQTLGIRPEAFLVLPKLFAMLLVLPLLTAIGDVAGIAGGMTIGVAYTDVPIEVYWSRTLSALDCVTFMIGIVKSVVYAGLISLCGCYFGFAAAGDAQGVGRGATKAVVSSIFFVVIADAILTLLFSFIGY